MLRRQVTDAIQRLEKDQVNPLTHAEAIRLAGKAATMFVTPFLVRSLRTEPADGAYAVTVCAGDVLFVNYVAPPGRYHHGTTRWPIVIDLARKPTTVFLTADEGVK